MNDKNLNETLDMLIDATDDIKQINQKFSEFNAMKTFLQTQIDKSDEKTEKVLEMLPQLEQYSTEIKNIKWDFDKKYEVIKNFITDYSVDKFIMEFQQLKQTVTSLESKVQQLSSNTDPLPQQTNQSTNETVFDLSEYMDVTKTQIPLKDYTFLGHIESQGLVKIINYKTLENDTWNSIKHFEYTNEFSEVSIDESTFGFSKIEYPIQIEFNLKKLSKPILMGDKIIYYEVNSTFSLSHPVEKSEIVYIGKDNIPSSFIENMLANMKNKLYPDRHWLKENRKSDIVISKEIITNFQNFNKDGWNLKYANVDKNNGKILFTTWLSKFREKNYFITFGNQVITSIIEEENFSPELYEDEHFLELVLSAN